MSRFFLLMLIALALRAQSPRSIPLDPAQMKLSHVALEKVTYKGRAAVRMNDDGTPKTADGSHVAILTQTDSGTARSR
jgi:hypothetical protein